MATKGDPFIGYTFVRFIEDHHGYSTGDVVRVGYVDRDSRGTQVVYHDKRPRQCGEAVIQWTDLAPLEELNAMETLAAAYEGKVLF